MGKETPEVENRVGALARGGLTESDKVVGRVWLVGEVGRPWRMVDSGDGCRGGSEATCRIWG